MYTGRPAKFGRHQIQKPFPRFERSKPYKINKQLVAFEAGEDVPVQQVPLVFGDGAAVRHRGLVV